MEANKEKKKEDNKYEGPYRGPVLLTVGDLAKVLHMGRQTIYNLLSTGELGIVPRRWGKGKRKSVVFHSDDVQSYINSLPVDSRFTD